MDAEAETYLRSYNAGFDQVDAQNKLDDSQESLFSQLYNTQEINRTDDKDDENKFIRNLQSRNYGIGSRSCLSLEDADMKESDMEAGGTNSISDLGLNSAKTSNRMCLLPQDTYLEESDSEAEEKNPSSSGKFIFKKKEKMESKNGRAIGKKYKLISSSSDEDSYLDSFQISKATDKSS